MSKSNMNGKTKNQEESNLKLLRELTHLPANRHCFDCGQRGPTYVNITIGSFICMSCSGLLRGLTPPQRVKSISMASFTPEEIELLKSRGNEYCRKVWLATCTTKDSHLGPENDPDRVNALKSFMSAKYEQKRYYIDPSMLPKSELTEIQTQTARALSSNSNSNNSTNSLQKSPSLSSASSASSLTQQQNQNNPSPVLNNLRNNQHNRLVNSITLPDIKPLSSLIGNDVIIGNSGIRMSGSGGENISGAQPNAAKIPGPNPISFINNLSNPPSSKMNNSSSGNSNFTNSNNFSNSDGPWGGDNNFNANFADFEDAFSPKCNDNFNDATSGSNHKTNMTATGVHKSGTVNGFVNSAESPNLAVNNFASFNNMPQPLLPNNTQGQGNQQGNFNSPSFSSGNTSDATASSEDRYAALKDLDSMFKQTFNGDGSGNGTTAQSHHGLPNSTSLPANLSSSVVPPAGSTGWFSTSPNQNPFSQGQHSQHPGAPGATTNGWSINGTSGSNGNNPHNPFFSTNNGFNGWPSPSNTSSNNSANSLFPASQANFSSSSVSTSVFPNSAVPSVGSTSNNLFSQQFTNHFTDSSSSKGKVFNPFFGSPAMPTVNPNNPFL